MLMNILKH